MDQDQVINTALLTIVFAAWAQAESFDFEKVPAIFCRPPLELSELTPDCEQNTTYTKAVKDCRDKLEKLEGTLGQEAVALSAQNKQSQQGELSLGGSEYQFSADALTYLQKVAKMARKQLEEYPHYVNYPGDPPGLRLAEERQPYALAVPCYRDAQARISEAQKFFDGKLARYAARLGEAKVNKARLTRASTEFESLSHAEKLNVEKAARKPAAFRKRNFEQTHSDITGTNRKAADLNP